MEGRDKLSGGDLMYVVGPDGKKQYVVDAQGTAYPLANPSDTELLKALDTQGRDPQRVSQEWLDTLHKGDQIEIPKITDGTPGAKANALTDLSLRDFDKVGEVIKANDGQSLKYYVVLPGKVARVSEFVATLLLNSGDLVPVGQTGEAQPVSPGAVSDSTTFEADKNWPTYMPKTVNDGTSATSGRNTVCNVLRSVGGGNKTTLSTWAGTDFPATLPTGSSSAYVTAGSGQLYRQVMGHRGRRRPGLPGHRHGPALRPAVQQRQHHRRQRHRYDGQAAQGGTERGQDRPDPPRLREGQPGPRPRGVVDVPPDGPAPVGGGGTAAAGFVGARGTSTHADRNHGGAAQAGRAHRDDCAAGRTAVSGTAVDDARSRG